MGGEKSDYLTRMFATICLGQFQLCFCSTQTLGTLLTYLPRSHNNPSFISSYHSSVNLFLLVSLPPSLSLSFCLFLSSYFGSQSVWPDFAKFRHFSKIKKSWAIFGIWWNFEPVLANFICYLAHFNCFKWPNIKTPFCHLVTLVWTAGMVQVSNFGFVDFLLPYLTFSFFFVLGSRLVIKMMNHKAWIKKVFSDNRWRF